jgi:hypothetical protein
MMRGNRTSDFTDCRQNFFGRSQILGLPFEKFYQLMEDYPSKFIFLSLIDIVYFEKAKLF